METICKIKVIRGAGHENVFCSFRIFVDGKFAGRVASSGALEVAAPAGRHTIEASLDWARSQLLEVVVRPGRETRIEVKNNWSIFLALWAGVSGSDEYLALQVI